MVRGEILQVRDKRISTRIRGLEEKSVVPSRFLVGDEFVDEYYSSSGKEIAVSAVAGNTMDVHPLFADE